MRGLAFVLSMWSGSAWAGSIQAPGVIGGPDSSAATPNPAAVYYNPGAVGAADDFALMIDVQNAFIRVDSTAWRNGGFDPNTGEAYDLATARVQVPVTFAGATFEIVDDRLVAGLGVTMPFLGGGDYTSSEAADAPPYTSHQRYFGVNTKVITLQAIPTIGFVPIKDFGLHFGVGLTYTIDRFSVVKASPTAGEEGLMDGNPYSTDAVLSGETTGSHIGWTAGVFYDDFQYAQIGASYTSRGQFNGTGEGEIEFPALFTGDLGEPVTLPAELAVAFPLPEVIRAALNSQVTDAFNVGLAWDHYRWHACCGTASGDIHVTVSDQQGNPVGSADDDNVSMEVSKELYSPRRLWDANNYALFTGYAVNEQWWVGGRVSYNQQAVPDYAVSATNLDFANAGFQLGSRVRLPMGKNDGGMTVGLSYSKFYLSDRRISGGAWNNGSTDERFSPTEAPLNVSGDGEYAGKVDILGIRLGWDS